MDRLRSLKLTDIDTSFYSNTSQGGYETAIDDSGMSLYFSINNDDDDGDGDGDGVGGDGDFDNNDDGWKDLSSASSVILLETNNEKTLMNSMAGGDCGSGNDFTMIDSNTNDISMKNDEQLESDEGKDVNKSPLSKEVSAASITVPTDSLVNFLIEERKSESPINKEIDLNSTAEPMEFNVSNQILNVINVKPTKLEAPAIIIQQSFDDNLVSTTIKSPSWSPQVISNHILSQSSFNEAQQSMVDMLKISKISSTIGYSDKNDEQAILVENDNIIKNINENKENHQQQRPTTSRTICYNINKRRTVLRLSGIMESPSVTSVAPKKSTNNGENENTTANKKFVTNQNKPTTKYSLAARKFVTVSPKPTLSAAVPAASNGAIPKVPNRRTSTRINVIPASPKLITTRTSKRRSSVMLNNNISASPQKPASKLSTRRSSAAFNVVTIPPKTTFSSAATTGTIPKVSNRRTTTFNVISGSPKLTTNQTSKRRSTAILNIIPSSSKPTRRSTANFNVITAPLKPPPSSSLSTTATASRSSKRRSTATLNVAYASPKHPKPLSSLLTTASSSVHPAKRRSTTNFNALNVITSTMKKTTPIIINSNRRSIRKSILNLQPTTSVTTIKKSPYKFRQPTTFNCKTCNKTFLQLSKLNAHEKIHNINNNNLKPSQSNGGGGGGGGGGGIINSCQYCDKKFAIKTILDKHLQENCDKISSVQRRKLLFQADNQLKQQRKQYQPLDRNNSDKQYRRSQRLANTLSTSPLSDCSSLSSSSNTPHAHSGIYRTPNKKIMCHECKIPFPNMITFLEHTETHPQNEFET